MPVRLSSLLVRDGLVVREPSPCDRRVSLAVLTDDGMTRLEEAAPAHVDSVRRYLLDHLTRAQIRQLGAAFESVQRRRAGIGALARHQIDRTDSIDDILRPRILRVAFDRLIGGEDACCKQER